MARLVILQHGARQQDYEIRKDRVGIGYLEDNDVCIADDEEVSKLHAVIEQERPGRYRLRDLGSLNGTYINERQIGPEPHRLRTGDRIRVGQTPMFFLHTEEDEQALIAEKQQDEVPGSKRLAPMPADPSAEPSPVRSSSRKIGDLLVLLEINKELNAETDLSRLLELIMDAAIHLIRADRGFLVLVSDGELQFMVARNVDYRVVHEPEFQISNSIIRRVVNSGEPVLTSNAQADLHDVQSVVDLELRSLLCIPLRVKTRVLGTLYLDSREETREAAFTEADRDLLMAFSDQAAIAIENARLLSEVKEAERVREELRIASMIQSSLLPREIPRIADLDVAGDMVTAAEVGGDYFDFITTGIDRGRGRGIVACIGDVSGKGVPAGLIMVMARSVLRPLVAQLPDTREVIVAANRMLAEDLKDGLFMSLLLCQWDPERGVLRYTVAGHEKPILYRARERSAELLEGGGIVLGVMEDIGSVLVESAVELNPGDALFLYTDGATEAVAPDGSLFGVEKLVAGVGEFGHLGAREIVDETFRRVRRHTRGAELRDDVTVLVIKRKRLEDTAV